VHPARAIVSGAVSGIAHWDEVEGVARVAGHLDAEWVDLGTAAGTVSVGLQLIRIAPGGWSTPAHVEHGEEEIFWVLRGSGLSCQDAGDGPRAYEVGPGDCLVHQVLSEAHTLRAGDEGMDVLAFGQRRLSGGAYLPRAGVSWFGPSWVRSGEAPPPWPREAQARAPEVPEPSPRPGSIVNVSDVAVRRHEGETVVRERRDLARAAGSEATGLAHLTVPEGKLAVPPHCHSAEEEIFVVLDGGGDLLLGTEEHALRAGSVVSRPAATRVPHTVRGGPGGIVYLAYGTREPADIVYMPRSGKVFLRGVGVIGRIEPLGYWEGED
jgi:uncharacterized cupin superfamily protein